MIFLDKALSFYLIRPLFLSIFLHNLYYIAHYYAPSSNSTCSTVESRRKFKLASFYPKHPRPSEGTRKLLSMFLGSHGTGVFPMELKPRPAPTPSHPNGYEVSRPEVVSNLTPEEAEEAKKIKARSSLEHLELAVGWQMFSHFYPFLP